MPNFRIPEILAGENQNIFIQLLVREFPGDPRDVITDEKASAELLSLIQKDNEDL